MPISKFECKIQDVKAKTDEGTGDMTFSGYGAVFGNVDWYGDVIRTGAFADSIQEIKDTNQWPPMLAQHGGWGMTAEDLIPIGVWTELKEDAIGLYVEGKLANTPMGVNHHNLLKMTPRPAIDGMSIGYIAKESIPRSKPEEPRRTLTKIKLIEISLVTFPANTSARITDVKSVTIRDLEEALRDAGCSREEAKRILSGGYRMLNQRDAEETEECPKELLDVIRNNISLLRKG